MAKPSIFSRNYERTMKKRRRRIIAIIVALALIISFFIYINSKGNVSNGIINKISSKFAVSKNNKTKKDKNKTNNGALNTKQDNKKNEVKKEIIKQQDKYITSYINNNISLKITYEEKNNKRIYKDVANSKSATKIYYDINPSKNRVIVYEDSSQKISLIDELGNVSDASKDKFVSRKGNVYLRENQIQKNKDYIWCDTPRFIDDETIAFISQLPWITNKGNKFIWFGNVKNGEYKYILNKKASNIEFESLSNKGLVVNMNNKTYYMSANGEFTQ